MVAMRASQVRALGAIIAGATICAVGLSPASSQETKKVEKPEIPGGIEGRVKSVDPQKSTLSITTSAGRERVFKITDDTTMLGPRGGKVRRRLNDPRFHEGMELTVVAEGSTAAEIHLGFSRREPAESADAKPAAKRSAADLRERVEERASAKATKKSSSKTAAPEEDADDDDEVPGKVKSFDSDRRLLVVALLNGKNRAFLLANNVQVVVKGTPSKQGLKDAALKEGASITVHVEAGGRRVRELEITPAAASRSKKAA